jgi:hypothetical protein
VLDSLAYHPVTPVLSLPLVARVIVPTFVYPAIAPVFPVRVRVSTVGSVLSIVKLSVVLEVSPFAVLVEVTTSAYDPFVGIAVPFI